MTRAVALIDGEHYASTVRDALAELPYDFVGAVLVVGTEKLREGAEYGVLCKFASRQATDTSSNIVCVRVCRPFGS